MDFETLEPFFHWITIHPAWSDLIVFLTAFAESLAFFGVIFPGAMMMFGFGALIAGHIMVFWPTLIAAVLGAIAGDGISFWIGHHFCDRLQTYWPFSRHPELLENGIAFFQKHGGKSILFGRFVGPIRPVIPVVAGMMGMPIIRFIGVNVLSGLAWGPAYLLPGMVFGASLSLAEEVASRLVIVLAGVIGVIWVFFLIAKHLVRIFQQGSRVVQTVMSSGLLLGGVILGTYLINTPAYPPDIRWVGTLEALQKDLITYGWKIPPSMSLSHSLKLLAPEISLQDLPLFSKWYEGQFEDAHWVYTLNPTTSQILAIRFWHSDKTNAVGQFPLWRGSIECGELWHPIPWINLLRTHRCP